MDSVVSNLQRLRARIAETAAACSRRPQDITLIAVSKTHAPAAIELALGAGQRAFGESTTQEALPKIEALRAQQPEWHFIGHLQSNKAKFIPGNFRWLHALDSLALAQRLSRLTESPHTALNVLIEVNVTRDPAKHGVLAHALPSLMEQLAHAALPGILLRG